MATPLPWSFSALNGFTQCPYRYLEVKVLKNFADESGEAAQWGTYVHKCLEDAITDDAPLPDNVKMYGGQAWAAIDGITDAQAEVKLAIDRNFQPCDWKDRWCGCITDVLKVKGTRALAGDWKLGKVKPSAQLKLNALMIFHHYNDVMEVKTKFIWLAHDKVTPEVFHREQIPEMWKSFMPDLKQYVQAFKTDTWQARPSGLCKNYCPVTTCQHNGGFTRNLKEV